MSLDAKYIFSYDPLPYVSPTPMEVDIMFLELKHGGEFVYLDKHTIFWDKPKYTLSPDEFERLMADQILEKKECEMWVFVKG